MEYVSTRGGAGAVDFEGALFSGYAPDGGLFMPQRIPSLDRDTLRRWSRLPYRELVKELCSLFITAELVPPSTLHGEPQPCRELLAGVCMRILGCSDAFARLCPILFAHPPEDGACCTIACSFLYPILLCHPASICYLLEKVSPVCK